MLSAFTSKPNLTPRFNYIKTELLSFFRHVGFRGSEVSFVPVSGMEGINLLETPTEPLLTSWYVGLEQGDCAGL